MQNIIAIIRLITTIKLCTISFVYSQILVPNFGFDIILDCPDFPDSIGLAKPWKTATLGTPDLLNSCSDNEFLKVPNAGRYPDSYQEARSDKGYAGIFVYGEESLVGNGEYIQAPLLEHLVAGSVYYIEFYVAPDISDTYLQLYTDGIGLAFKENLNVDTISGTDVLPYQPVIQNTTGILKNRGWVKISGCYTADGNEKVVVIGNFKSIAETKVEKESNNFSQNLNYFFIEDVGVFSFNLLMDTTLLCDNSRVTLEANFPEATIVWSTGHRSSKITVNEENTYYVNAFINGCVLRDSTVVINPKSIEEMRKIDGCKGDSLILYAKVPGFKEWRDGLEDNLRMINESGTYSYVSVNECGEYKSEIEVAIEECGCNFYIPNIFSPNNDGYNDVISLNFTCEYPFEFEKFEIFDKYGNLVYFSSNSSNINFAGYYNGGPLNSGIYVWQISYRITRNGIMENKRERGDITLVR